MPLVNVRYKQRRDLDVDKIQVACSEIVPAGLHTEGEGSLSPGSIEFFASPLSRYDRMNVDVFLDIEAYDLPSRHPAEARANQIKEALKELFPGFAFAIMIKLVTHGWTSDAEDIDYSGDMSMVAAIARFRSSYG